MNRTLVNKTKSFCCDCQTLHEASVVAEDGKIYFEVQCPEGMKKAQISSDSELFLKIRSKSFIDRTRKTELNKFTWFHILEITENCNFSCPVCFASAESSKPVYLSVPEIINIAGGLKKKKLKAVTLSGGEPTLHPELFSIIKKIKKMRMDVTLLTNGFICGENPEFAKSLKKSGLNYCYFQFDTLNSEVHKKLRGNDFIEIKKGALLNAKNAKLHFGIISTFIKDNLAETGKILKFAAGYVPSLSIITFLAAAKTGRFNIEEEQLVDRESIIKSIIDSGEVENLTAENFYPFPLFQPLGIDIHPDCTSLLYLALRKGRYEPLDKYLNIDRLYRLMSRSRGGVNIFRGFILFNIFFTLSIRIKKVIPLYKMIFGLITGIGHNSIVVVAIEQFMNEVYQDQERIDHCTNCVIMKDGTMVPACIFQHPDTRRSEYTRMKMKDKRV